MVKIQHNISLWPFNTFGLKVKASQYIEVRNEALLSEIFLKKNIPDEETLVLGGGSNMLFTRDYPGRILHIVTQGKRIVSEDPDQLVLEVAAGENWHGLVLSCIEQGWGGIENLSLIPGRVGAAPIQNIGAYGVELKDVFEYLDAMHMDSGKIERYSAADCQFGYRDSVFKRALKGKAIILRLAFRLSKRGHSIDTSYGDIQRELEARGITEPDIRDVSQAVIAIRQSKLPDPAQIGNGGSFFKNPEISTAEFERLRSEFPGVPGYVISEEIVKVPAAWLIDQAGWKGRRFGNYGVHDRQALVLVNHGGASGQDIYDLSTRILESVRERYGIELEREVNVI